jgi:hypothetical protein
MKIHFQLGKVTFLPMSFIQFTVPFNLLTHNPFNSSVFTFLALIFFVKALFNFLKWQLSPCFSLFILNSNLNLKTFIYFDL